MTATLRRIDIQLMTVVLLLCAIGVIAVHSCTRNGAGPTSMARLQTIYVIVGLLMLGATALIDPGRLRSLAWPIYLGVMLLLVIVLMAGQIRGTTRWLSLGPVNLQPAELAKIAVIAMIGAFVARADQDEYDFGFLLRALAYVAAPSALILLQPDLGIPIVMFFIWLAMMFVLGAKPLHLGAFVLAAVLLFAAAWGVGFIRPHQRDRLTSFMDPERDPRGASYHLRQSLIAVGGGHLWGQGLFHGKQSQADFIPDQHTDFIFTVIAEELGFVGAASVLVLYALLLYRALMITARAPGVFERVVGAGIVAMFLIQIYTNIGMTVGLAPVKGMALPFLSYGGSSLVANMIAVGMLQSIHIRREQIVF